MRHVRATEMPSLHDALLVAAFAGWNDASEVATSAVQFLIREWDARRFAEIDPEEFYVFTERRPTVRLGPGARRRIEWPANELYYQTAVGADRDAVLLVGVEPHLRWKTFVESILDVAGTCNVSTVITLGGLLADVPHSRPARLSGSSNDPDLNARLRARRVAGSRYEGPTGIIGVLNATCASRNVVAASLWGNVPHYISASMNPKVTGALLERLSALFDLRLDLTEWVAMTGRFDAEIAQALAKNPEIARYVRELEARGEGEVEPESRQGGESPRTTPAELPDSETILRELEEFLRQDRPDDSP
ncbi:MAG: PAC2 family protein [Chloroflexi bacterium]|nr:PAC2 family protein [Chloroflexota bacterium]